MFPLQVSIYTLYRIHNTKVTSAYFGLDKRECEYLGYVFSPLLILNFIFTIKTSLMFRRENETYIHFQI
jgi:hypothetical protein